MAENKHWYVLKVRSNFEGLVAQELRNRQFEVLLLEDDRRLHRPATASASPFAGCLFCRFDLVDRLKVLLIPGVLWVTGFPEPQRMDDADIWRFERQQPASRHAGPTGKPRPKSADANQTDLGF
jgi:hypothetical protein